ncbi:MULTISPECIES: hypothetical protein [Candidatus Cardinium]|uniref:hypothetical protein n=1 Tax=Candidatus Cardinium TaxID=273135 RepID=UPI001FA99CDF|nr:MULTISPECIES: hypothetical protein [Cardinium]
MESIKNKKQHKVKMLLTSSSLLLLNANQHSCWDLKSDLKQKAIHPNTTDHRASENTLAIPNTTYTPHNASTEQEQANGTYRETRYETGYGSDTMLDRAQNSYEGLETDQCSLEAGISYQNLESHKQLSRAATRLIQLITEALQNVARNVEKHINLNLINSLIVIQKTVNQMAAMYPESYKQLSREVTRPIQLITEDLQDIACNVEKHINLNLINDLIAIQETVNQTAALRDGDDQILAPHQKEKLNSIQAKIEESNSPSYLAIDLYNEVYQSLLHRSTVKCTDL